MDQLAQRLHQERLRRGLTTFELAERTKIREPYIQALESGTYNVLPSVYVRSFIRTLGTELGIAQPEVSRLIAQCIDATGGATSTRHQQSSDAASVVTAGEKSPDPLLTFIDETRSMVKQRSAELTTLVLRDARKRRLIAIGLVVLAASVWWYWNSSRNTPATSVPPEIVDISNAAEQDSLILTAIATDTAELTLTIDGVRSFKTMLLPETDYRWSAIKRFTISNIFNAGALQFSRDGKPLPVYGKRGEVLRELVITRTEVTASNSSVKVLTPASTESMRRDSIREQQRRDSIRAVRKKEDAKRKEEVGARRPQRAKSAAKSRRNRQNEAPILRPPPRAVR
jgi:transcriptional regulator with XRE-family HTH domain